jgi:hypothetical protein
MEYFTSQVEQVAGSCTLILCFGSALHPIPQGNAAFKAGNWQLALRHYKAAIEADSVDVRAYANRAQVGATAGGGLTCCVCQGCNKPFE